MQPLLGHIRVTVMWFPHLCQLALFAQEGDRGSLLEVIGGTDLVPGNICHGISSSPRSGLFDHTHLTDEETEAG